MSAKRHSRIARAALLTVLAAGGLARADLIGYWNFDDNTDDQSGFGNNGTLENGATFDTDIPPSLTTGKSLLLSGGAYVLVPHNDSLNITDTMTIAAWVQPLGNIGWDGVLAKNPSDGSPLNHAGNYELRLENGSRLVTFLYQQGGFADTTGTNSTIPTSNGLWQHVAVTVQKSGQALFYLNGSAAGVRATTAGFGATNTQPLYIGSRADFFTSFDGRMDEVRIYNNVLTAEEIATLANVPPPEPPHPGLSPILARASSEFTGDGRLAAHAVNGNGINGKAHVNNPPGGTMWLTSGSDFSPTFEMDLGGVHNLTDLRLYNYNENANPACCLDRGVNEVDVYVAGADLVYPGSPDAHFTFAKAPGTQTDFSELKSLAGLSGRYIKLAILSNHGDPDYTGISEVKVNGTPVPGKAPLPATIHSVSSNLVGFNRLAKYTVDRSGMGFADTHTPVPDAFMWLSQGTLGTVSPDQFDTNPEITFDVGAVTPLSYMKVWNYNEYFNAPRFDELLGRGIATADIYTAGEDLNFTLLLPNQAFDRAPADGTVDFGQIVDLLGVNARYVKFDILTNHLGKDFNDPFSDDGFNDFAGLSEVQFFTGGTLPVDVRWNVDGGGTWGEASNWLSPAVPNGIGHIARFGSALVTGNATVTLDGDRTVGAMHFDNGFSYTIAGPGTLTLDSGGPSANITVASGSHFITAAVAVANSLTVDTASDTSLEISQGISLTGTLTKKGGGLLSIGHTRGGNLDLLEGTVSVIPNGGDSGTSHVTGLLIILPGALDLNDNDMIVSGLTVEEVQAYVAAGRNLGTWDGPGIRSTAAALDPLQITGLAVVVNELGRTEFNGLPVTDSDVLIKYTYNGDTDLNGIVDADDYFRIDSGFARDSARHMDGDIDYSGTIDADDYFLIDKSFSLQSGALGVGVAVPEPASLSLLALGAAASLRSAAR